MRSIIAIAAVLALATPSGAERLSDEVRHHAVIEDGEGVGRILFKLEPPGDLGRVVVSRATARFNVSGGEGQHLLRLRAYPVTKAWDASTVSWTGDWARPGGDFNEDLYSLLEVDLGRGQHAVELDLTALVKEALEEEVATYGFIVTLDPALGRGIDSEELARFSGLSEGTLDVSYRRVSPRPNARRD